MLEALEEELVPWGEIPCLRALAAASLLGIREHLEAGLQSEAEAWALTTRRSG